MAVDFCDYFWGEENNGWNVLYQNMKQGLYASKELSEFFKEKWSTEEVYSKALTKMANKMNNNNERGTLTPIFNLLKTSMEMMSNAHLHMVNKIQELVKELNKYNDDLHKKHKGAKDEESQTEEAVKSLQATGILALKAKDTYNQRCHDFEKSKREGSTPKEVEKAEVKLRKAHDDYKSIVEKYNLIREDFDKKMTDSCKRFQTIEENHLSLVLQFGQNYMDIIQTDHKAIGQIQADLIYKYSQFTIDKLLDNFARAKHTGLEKPIVMVFEDCSSLGSAISGQYSPDPSADHSKSSMDEASSLGMSTTEKPSGVLAAGFLRSRRDKKKEKNKKKKKDTDSPNTKDDKSDNENTEDAKTADLISVEGTSLCKKNSEKDKEKMPSSSCLDSISDDKYERIRDTTDNSHQQSADKTEFKVDEEGYAIRSDLDKTEKSFDSTSDSDSDSDVKKIHVEIKPISNGKAPTAASVAELRATIEGMSLYPMGFATTKRSTVENQCSLKKSNSVTQEMSSSASDLLGLNLNLGKDSDQVMNLDSKQTIKENSAESTNKNNLSANLATSVFSPSNDRYSELTDVVENSSPETATPPILPPKGSRGSTPTPIISLPRPQSRKIFETTSMRSGQSPSSALTRAESTSSLEFRTSGMSGISRGPSPLTLGMTDTIPLAVAFQEHCHAYFRGTDESKVQMKITGEMMISFPAGIVGVLANNPTPAQLSFKVLNFNNMSNPLPNKQLIKLDESQSSENLGVYNFNMDALSTLLKRQSEHSPSASFFNVDIIKYQVTHSNGAKFTPLQLVSYWRCDDEHTDIRVDYRYNVASMAQPSPLLNVVISVQVDGIVQNMQSKPHGQWLKDQQKAQWKLSELSENSADGGKGSLRGKFEVAAGPSTPATVSAQFICEGTTLSGLGFALIPSGYRVSLIKKRFVSGKYICDADAVLRLRYGTPS